MCNWCYSGGGKLGPGPKSFLDNLPGPSVNFKKTTTSKGDKAVMYNLSTPGADKGTYWLVLKRLAYDKADDYCKALGGRLASIHSNYALEAANDAAANAAWDAWVIELWVGLRSNADGQWGWADRSALDFIKWTAGIDKVGVVSSYGYLLTATGKRGDTYFASRGDMEDYFLCKTR